MFPRRALDDAVLQGDEGFVHTAVIAPIENQNFWTAGDLAGEADREAIGIGGSQSKLPVGQAEAPSEFFAHPHRILARQHQRDTTSNLLLHGGDGGRGRVARHGPSVAEAEIDVAMAVHVQKLGTMSFADEGRESAGPFCHPVHGHTAEQRLASTLEQGLGLWPFINEFLLFKLH